MKQSRSQDASSIRSLLTREIKRSKKSRAQIADEMGAILGLALTERMITSFTSESKELHRWPAQFDIAFCEVIQSYALLRERVRLAGFRMIAPEEEELIRIGRAFIAREKAQLILDTKSAEVRG